MTDGTHLLEVLEERRVKPKGVPGMGLVTFGSYVRLVLQNVHTLELLEFTTSYIRRNFQLVRPAPQTVPDHPEFSDSVIS